jgi:hypothetical protein
LKKTHSIFWNGTFGGSFEIVDVKENKNVFAFYRENEKEKGLVFLNLSDKPADFSISCKKIRGHYMNYFTSSDFIVKEMINLPAYGYLVLLKDL